MIKEMWKPVVGYEGYYSASSFGRVQRNAGTYGTAQDRILTPAISFGYQRVTLSIGNSQRNFQVHRLIAEAFLGHQPDGQEVNHKNGVKHDNRIENLEWVTKSQNNAHRCHILHRSNTQKLNWEKVRTIRQQYALGITRRKLADEHGVGLGAIYAIIRGKNWKENSYSAQEALHAAGVKIE